MAYSIYDHFVANSAGDIVNNATVTVNNAGGGLAQIYVNRLGTPTIDHPSGQLDNPLTVTNGRITFYAPAVGRYTITAATAEGTVIFSDVLLPAENPATLEDIAALTIENVAALASTPVVAGRTYYLKEYGPESGCGGGALVGRLGVITPNNVTTFASATVGAYFERVDFSEIDIFMAGAERGADIKAALQACHDASPGTHDITTAYIYEPSWKIRVPYGNYYLSDRVLITKNNIIIEGDGMFNTNIKSISNQVGDPVQAEMIRFRGAYACGIKNLTLDGGLPFNLTGSVSYGCRIPLVLDQVAHFDMDGFNSCNYRTRGIQCIHVWESKFGEIRCFNGWGFDDGLGIIPGGLVFDGYSKEENTFSGSESNQIEIQKYAFSGAGSPLRWDSPCFNIVINQIVWEGRTYNTYEPDNMNAPKIYISGLSANCGIKHGWVYFHDQPFASNAVFIDAENAGPGCYVRDVNIYQENAAPGVNFMEIIDLIETSSAYPITVDLSVTDIDATTDLLGSVTAGTSVKGNIFYRNGGSRTLASFAGSAAENRFFGEITMSIGAFGSPPPVTYAYKASTIDVSNIGGSGVFPEYKCRAWANVNGNSGGGIRASGGFTSITRSAQGVYDFVFEQNMPDVNYAVISNNQQNATNTDHIQITSIAIGGFTLTVEDSAGVDRDTAILSVAVFR